MTSPAPVYRFSGCELDVGRRELRRAGAVEAVQPKVFDLILFLLENRERAVSKDELQDAVWAGTIVTETALTRAIMKARKVLGDDPEHQSVIRTIQRHGYRFVADLEESPGTEADIGLGPIQFVRSHGAHIAWRTAGEGPEDLIFVPGFICHLELFTEFPPVRRFLASIGEGRRVILFDKRGMGLSERVGYAPTLANTAEDILAVMEAAGSRRAVLFGLSEGGPAALWFARHHPERVRKLVIWGSMAKGSRSPDYPWALRAEQYDQWLEAMMAGWGSPPTLTYFAPSVKDDPETRQWWAKVVRTATTPESMRAVLEALRDVDVRSILSEIEVPTIVFHRTNDKAIPVAAGRYLAEHIPGARLVELPGDDHWCWVGEPVRIP